MSPKSGCRFSEEIMLQQKASAQPLGRKYFLMLSPSVLNRTEVPRNWRICFLVRLIMPWRLRDWVNITFPVAVTLKRFLAPDLVLILGIWLSCSSSAAPHWRPHGNAHSERHCSHARLLIAWL